MLANTLSEIIKDWWLNEYYSSFLTTRNSDETKEALPNKGIFLIIFNPDNSAECSSDF